MHGVMEAGSGCRQVQFEQRISSKSWAGVTLVHENIVLLGNIQSELHECLDKGSGGWLADSDANTLVWGQDFSRISLRALLYVEQVINQTPVISQIFVCAQDDALSQFMYFGRQTRVYLNWNGPNRTTMKPPTSHFLPAHLGGSCHWSRWPCQDTPVSLQQHCGSVEHNV